MVVGIILTEPYSRALHDVSSFHHGHLEGEFNIAVGMKYGCPCSRDYLFRCGMSSGLEQQRLVPPGSERTSPANITMTTHTNCADL